jgi:hypothetical protein
LLAIGHVFEVGFF